MVVERISGVRLEMNTTVAVEPKAKPGEPSKASDRTPEKKEAKREDAEFLRDVLELAQQHFQIRDVGLKFEVRERSGRIKVTMFDKKTGEVIREIPPQQVLDLLRKTEGMIGLLFDQNA